MLLVSYKQYYNIMECIIRVLRALQYDSFHVINKIYKINITKRKLISMSDIKKSLSKQS